MLTLLGSGQGQNGGGVETAFVFTVKTDNAGTSAANQFTIPITSATPYNIKTSDGQSITGATGATTLTFPSAGTYTVKITESCEGWRFNNGGDKFKLLNISNWGVYKNTVTNAFKGASNMTCSAIEAPLNAPTTMNSTFSLCPNFNGAVGNWDVSGVADFFSCFSGATVFNQSLAAWDTSLAATFKYMFNGCSQFNQSINSWNTNSIVGNGYSNMFQSAISFNQPLDTWNLSNATDVNSMFSSASSFNQPLDNWDMSSVTDMGSMFYQASSFNQDISGWDTSSVTTMVSMFYFAGSFNNGGDPSINNWNTSNVTNMINLFSYASVFNQPIGNWDVSNVIVMYAMFNQATVFNQDISTWNVTSNITSFSSMFNNARAFDSDISSWDTSGVTNMDSMFIQAYDFNQDISGWNTSNVTNFKTMFRFALDFNQPIGSWDTSSAIIMTSMLENTQLDQDLSNWNITQVTSFGNFKSLGATLSTSNYDALLVAWEAQLQTAYPGGAGYTPVISISFGVSKYTLGGEAEAARTSLINTYGWTITDGGGVAEVPFVFDATPFGGSKTVSILTQAGYTYDYNVSVSTGESFVNQTGNLNINFLDSAIRTFTITGLFPGFRCSETATARYQVITWGSQLWRTLAESFEHPNFTLTSLGSDVPNLNLCTSMYQTFKGVVGFPAVNNLADWNVSNVTTMKECFKWSSANNLNISSWNTSRVADFERMFDVSQFNGDISSWDTSSATNMQYMFSENTLFNQNISSWNTSNVTTFRQIFYSATGNMIFNQPIGSWNTSSANNMRYMLSGCGSFDQDVSNWDINLVTDFSNLFQFSTLSTVNYDATLISWANQAPLTNKSISFGGSQYTPGGAAEAARNTLINTYGWTITDGGGIAAPFTTNLVASYNFDADFTDYTGNHPLTSAGNVTAGTAGGVVSNCSDFGGGATDFLTAVDSDDFSFTDGVSDLPFSVSMWVNFDVVANSWFFDKRGTSPNDEYQITYYSGSFAIALASQGGFAAYLNATYAITPVVGTWYHLTWTYDGSGTFAGIKLYIDGVSQALTDISVGTYVGMSNGTALPRFGRFTSGFPFNGKMDETHIWKNRELTAAEVTDIYTTELAGNSILP